MSNVFEGTTTSSGGWGSFLEAISSSVDEKPATESETQESEAEQDENETIETDSEESEANDEQPETESEADDSEEDAEIDMGTDKDGTPRKAVKMSELKEGYMRQADYTRKTNELATQRKELEAERESLKDAQGFKDHMEANPWLWEQVNRALIEFENTGDLPIDEVLQDAQYGRYVNHLMAENAKLEKALKAATGDLEGIKLQSSMQSLKTSLAAEYGDLVTDEFMSAIQERMTAENLTAETVREIAEGQLAKKALGTNKQDVKKASKRAAADAVQKLAETKRTAPKAATQTSARPAAPAKPEAKGWRAWFEANDI